MQIPFYIYIIGFSLLVGIINFRWLKPCRLQVFVPFLALTLGMELTGVYIKYVMDTSNAALYNAYTIVQVVFCSLFLHSVNNNIKHSRIIVAALIIYVLLSLLTYLYFANFRDFNIPLFLLGGFMVVLFSIFFLVNYFSSDDQREETAYEPVIWVATGLIAYFAVLSITVTLITYIRLYELEISGVKLYNLVPRIMSIIMYLCFAYAFYKCRKLNRK